MLLITATTLLQSCVLKVRPLNQNESKWFLPYQKADTAIFHSQQNETDTIIFEKTKIETDTVKNPIELGYYITRYYTVPYHFSEQSFHQSAKMGYDNKRYDQNLFNLSVTSDGRTEFEITFIGTIFYGKALQRIKKISDKKYYFNSKYANYQGMNVEQGINDFMFDTSKGIIGFTDERNVIWYRKM